MAITNRANDLKDAKVTSYIEGIKKKDSAAMSGLMDYCLDRIEKASK